MDWLDGCPTPRQERHPYPSPPQAGRADTPARYHTQTEVAAALGVSRRLIYNHASRYDITFKTPTRGGARNLVHNLVDMERDAKFAERIRAFMELGISQRQCCGKLVIGSKAFERIIAAHGIDYPKARKGSTSCAA